MALESDRQLRADRRGHVAFGLPHEVALESIRCFGEEVLPHFDTDPVHRTTRMRYGADADAIAADPRLAAQPYDSAPPAAATN